MKVRVYSKNDCPWCIRAKQLLEDCNIQYNELMYGIDFSKQDLIELTGQDKPTVPQIFFNDKLIGGCTDLQEYLKD